MLRLQGTIENIDRARHRYVVMVYGWDSGQTERTIGPPRPYILTCTFGPISPDVVIDVDEPLYEMARVEKIQLSGGEYFGAFNLRIREVP